MKKKIYMDKKRIISEELQEKRERGRMGAREEGRESEEGVTKEGGKGESEEENG